MSGLRWRRAVGSDLPALSGFLEEREESRVGFSGRLLRASPGAKPALRLPSPLRGAVWVFGSGSEIGAAVLCHPSRLVYPIFPPKDAEGDGDFALLASSFSPASVIGMAQDVQRYESAVALAPRATVAYRLMALEGAGARLSDTSAPLYRGLCLRLAGLADLEALLPLQEAYEREEVLTPIHEFNASGCRASLARALERQIVYVAEEGGVIVAKAGTNARGFRVDQIGVFTPCPR
jgi:hypothetical protein